MKAVTGILFISILLIAQGCSKETVKRAAYDSGQLVGQQQCRSEFSADCPEPDSYDEYQRKRKELHNSDGSTDTK